MENHVKKLYHRLPMFLVGLVVWSSLFVSCKDDYPYDDTEPDWLGESVYEYLVADGNYKNFVKIIDDLEYSEVLRKTGSKTLFVADDDAFKRFFAKNDWGVSQYSDLTESQKKLILNFSVVNNSYLIETLSNYYDNTLIEGSALRRNTTVSYFDSVPYVLDNKLPVTPYWKDFLEDTQSGMYLLQDGSGYPLVHFLQRSLDYYGITDADFKTMTGIDRQRNDAHIYSHKVIQRDIACKNGYVHKLDDLLTPPSTMAAYIRTVPELSLFSTMLDWFSAPYIDAQKTQDYKAYLEKKNIPFNKNIYVMRYFNKAQSDNGGKAVYPDGTDVPKASLLTFNPGYNNYINPTGSLQSDMAAIFAPTNEALDEYLTQGKGRALYDRYGEWENIIPKETDTKSAMDKKYEILSKLINRHMRESLVISIPSLFYKMVDNTSSSLGTKKEDIVDSLNYIGLNGLVYATNKVYPPDDFVSVYAPAFFGDKTNVINKAISQYQYNLYLNSMINKYAFIAPTDKALKFYIDPVTYGLGNLSSALEFWYDTEAQALKANVYEYNKATKTVGRKVGVVTDEGFIKSRLVNILDQSIVVKDFCGRDGKYQDGYYTTKDGNVIKVTGLEGIGENVITSRTTSFQGGGDVLAKPEQFVHPRDSGIYHQENGTTFLTDTLVQTPLRGVYSILSDATNYPEFKSFFELLSGFPMDNDNKIWHVFIHYNGYYGIDDYNIKFFNSFRYTVYVPDNQAMADAYNNHVIKPWSEIDAMEDGSAEKTAEIEKLERFVRYHFQDNSVFITPNQTYPDSLKDAPKYQTATIKTTDPDIDPSFLGTSQNKFYRIAITDTTVNTTNGAKPSVNLTCEKNGANPYTVTVDVSNDKYFNIMTRDYVFSIGGKPERKPGDIGSLSEENYTKSQIVTSSTAVIHRIGKVLRFE